MAKPLRIVLDTNALLMSLPRKSPYRPIFDAFLSGKIHFLIDNAILSEYIETIGNRSDYIVAQNVGELLVNSPHVMRINVTTKWLLIVQDPDDDKFVDCAVADPLSIQKQKSFQRLFERIFKNIKVPTKAAFSMSKKIAHLQIDLHSQRIAYNAY